MSYVSGALLRVIPKSSAKAHCVVLDQLTNRNRPNNIYSSLRTLQVLGLVLPFYILCNRPQQLFRVEKSNMICHQRKPGKHDHVCQSFTNKRWRFLSHLSLFSFRLIRVMFCFFFFWIQNTNFSKLLHLIAFVCKFLYSILINTNLRCILLDQFVKLSLL